MIDNNIIPEWSAMSTAQKANFIRYAVSALRRGEPIDLTNLAEAWKLFYGDYLLACGGKLHSEGGHIYSGTEEESQQIIRNITPWKALDNIEYYAIPDTSFTRSKTGIGDIEYFSAEHPEGITYPNGYHKDHPMPGKDVLLYNPNNNDAQDIRLDALHIMPKDATYDALNLLYREAAKDGDVAYNAKRRYEEDTRKYGKENIDSYELYFNNEADGLLRNILIEGSPEYIENKRYYPNKEELKQWNSHLLPYIHNIQHYLETGKRPENILKEVTITAPNKKSLGGNLFSGTKTNTLNLKDLKIGVRDIISYINKYKAADYWTQDDINHLASKLYSTGWDPEAILYVIGTESSYNPNAANPVSSARGLALITNGTASDIFGEKNYKSIMNQYNSKKRTTHDSIDDAFRYYSHIDKLITKNRDNMGYGRLKINMLAPYATLDTAIKNVNGIYDSLTSNQKKYVSSLEKKLGRKATFADLMEMYDKEFNNRDRKKELIEYAPPAVDLDTPVNIPPIIMPTDAILLQEVPIMPEAATKISYIPTNPVNNYVEATTEKTSGEELAGLKALNAFREAMSFNHMMLDLNRLLYSELPAWDPLGVINNPLEFFKLKDNGGNLLALGTDDTEDPEEEIKTVYRSKLGNVFNTRNEAIEDNVTLHYPKESRWMHHSGGDKTPFKVIGNNLIFPDSHYYTGAFRLGEDLLTEKENAVKNRDLIELYLNRNENGFEKILNASPITVYNRETKSNDTWNYPQYVGNILPQDTLYLRPESEKIVQALVENKDLLPIDLALFAHPDYIGRYANISDKRGKVLDDVGLANISFKRGDDGNYYADVFDKWDFDKTVSLGNWLEGRINNKNLRNGPFILRQQIPIVFTRGGESDGMFLSDISSGAWKKYLELYKATR